MNDGKSTITPSGVERLVDASRRMPLGTSLEGILHTGADGSYFLPTIPFKDENGSGQIYSDRLKEGTKLFLSRDFFKKFLWDLKLRIINHGSRIIFYYDEKGRVYFKDNTGKIYYINRSMTGAMTIDRQYCEIIKDTFEIEYFPDVFISGFDFLYVTEEAFLSDKEGIDDFSKVTSISQDFGDYERIYYPNGKIYDFSPVPVKDNNVTNITDFINPKR